MLVLGIWVHFSIYEGFDDFGTSFRGSSAQQRGLVCDRSEVCADQSDERSFCRFPIFFQSALNAPANRGRATDIVRVSLSIGIKQQIDDIFMKIVCGRM